VDEDYFTVPLGKADIVRGGGDVTIVTYGTMVFVAAAAAAAMNLDAEIIDLRSLVPLDVDTICSSVRKDRPLRRGARSHPLLGIRRRDTLRRPGRVLLGLGSAHSASDGWDTPYPHAFEWEYFPGQARVATALKAVMELA